MAPILGPCFFPSPPLNFPLTLTVFVHMPCSWLKAVSNLTKGTFDLRQARINAFLQKPRGTMEETTPTQRNSGLRAGLGGQKLEWRLTWEYLPYMCGLALGYVYKWAEGGKRFKSKWTHAYRGGGKEERRCKGLRLGWFASHKSDKSTTPFRTLQNV